MIVDKLKVETLVDTGTAVSVISDKLRQRLKNLLCLTMKSDYVV